MFYKMRNEARMLTVSTSIQDSGTILDSAINQEKEKKKKKNRIHVKKKQDYFNMQ